MEKGCKRSKWKIEKHFFPLLFNSFLHCDTHNHDVCIMKLLIHEYVEHYVDMWIRTFVPYKST